MPSRQRNKFIFFLICAAAFTAGLVQLFWLRFQAGDLYPPYCSLRGDPLGTQVLFESIKELPAKSVRQNFKPLDQIKTDSNTSVILLGLKVGDPLFYSDIWDKFLDRLKTNGGRLVLAFKPINFNGRTTDDSSSVTSFSQPGQKIPEDGEATPENGQPAEERDAFALNALPLLKISLHKIQASEPEGTARLADDQMAQLPDYISWRSPVYLKANDPSWKIVYTWNETSAVAMRPYGKASVVVSADSYLFSNEALLSDRFTNLLVWFIQPENQVVVDEFHHGVIRRTGIIDLGRKYGLYGVAAVFLTVAILFIWRQTAVFLPRPVDFEEDRYTMALSGDAQQGWINLIKQHISNQELLKICFKAWRSSAASNRVPEERLEKIEQLVLKGQAKGRHNDPVALYRQICQLLKKGKHL